MATYETYILNLGPYQEGNKADIELEMDNSFSMSGVSVTLQVRDQNDRLLIDKTSEDDEILISGQSITIPLTASEMVKRNGKHNYEIDFLDSYGDPFATIKGTFTVNKEVNKA